MNYRSFMLQVTIIYSVNDHFPLTLRGVNNLQNLHIVHQEVALHRHVSWYDVSGTCNKNRLNK